jgi:hypothetical protein
LQAISRVTVANIFLNVSLAIYTPMGYMDGMNTRYATLLLLTVSLATNAHALLLSSGGLDGDV